jgi:hypothetical protein
MALERRNPLPEGRYWYDALGSRRELFQEWDETAPRDAVKVISTVDHPDESPPRTWFLFEVTEPTNWPQTALGFPNTGEGVDSEDDTIQRPDPARDPVDILEDASKDAASSLATLLLVIVGLYFFGKGN